VISAEKAAPAGDNVDSLLAAFNAALAAHDLLHLCVSALNAAQFAVQIALHTELEPDAEYALRLWASSKDVALSERCVDLDGVITQHLELRRRDEIVIRVLMPERHRLVCLDGGL
jgi:hypothetical protein